MVDSDKNTKDIVGTEFNIDFLKNKLIEVCHCDGELESWDAEQIAKGQGFLSIIVKVTLQWKSCKNCKLPSQVIVKTPFQENLKELMKDIMPQEMIDQMLGKEDELLNPLSITYLNEIAALKYFNGERLKIPKLFIDKTYTSRQDQGYVVIESMAESSTLANMCDGLSVGQVKSVLETLGQMQAQAIKDPRWRGEIQGFPDEMMDQWADSLPITKKQLIELRPEKFEPLVEQLNWIMNAESMKKYMSTVKEIAMEENNPNSMFVHGDMHANNILFIKNDNGTASDELSALIDWQISHAGSIMEDISRLFLMLNTEDRRRETENLLDLYYESVISNLHGKKCPFDRPWLSRAWKAYFPFGCCFQMMFCPMLVKMDQFAGTQERIDRIVNRTEDIMIECLELERTEHISTTYSDVHNIL